MRAGYLASHTTGQGAFLWVSGSLWWMLALTGCGDSARSPIDPALAAMVPADAVMLAGVRMEALRATPVYEKLLSLRRLSELDEFAGRTNFDPRKDVREMLVASDGADAIVLARGNFRVAPPKDATQSAYKGATIYVLGGRAFAILNPTTAVAGSETRVRNAIDRKSGGAALLEKARALPATSHLWAVALGWGRLEGRILASPNLFRIANLLESATLHADLGSGVQAAIDGVARSDADAKKLGDAARGIVGLGRLSAPRNQPELLRLYDGIKVEQQQRSVRIAVQVPAELVDHLLKIAEPGL